MNHTANYNLPQWEKSDRILMDDFNSAMSAIDSGIKDAKSQAASAQSTANSAATKKNYVTGSYTGNGASRTIILNFRPSFVIVSGLASIVAANETYHLAEFFGATGGRVIPSRLECTATGFIVHLQDNSIGNFPNLTQSGRTYDYIAFR